MAACRLDMEMARHGRACLSSGLIRYFLNLNSRNHSYIRLHEQVLGWDLREAQVDTSSFVQVNELSSVGCVFIWGWPRKSK
jgi:hypothetical protein